MYIFKTHQQCLVLNCFKFVLEEKFLLKKKCILFFGEGYTDNVFIRSLKPIKKGPARIGFQTMVASNWEVDIKIQTIGLNYADPKRIQSDLVIACGKILHLKDYKDLYEENSSKAINKITIDIENEIKKNITYVHDKELAPFVENIMKISHKGMNHENNDGSIPLFERYNYSKNLATKINTNYKADNSEWTDLKDNLEKYYLDTESQSIDDNWVYQFAKTKKKNTLVKFIYLFFAWPIVLVGLTHCFIPYILVKSAIEKAFKRDVFWSGVKLFAGSIIFALFNIYSIFLFYDLIYESYWLGTLYFLTVPAITGVIAYNYFKKLKDLIKYVKTHLRASAGPTGLVTTRHNS